MKPTHSKISAEVHNFVNLCMDTEHSHNREGLDDLIADLLHYRNTLPTVEEYVETGEL